MFYPQATIRLMKGVPLDNTYRNTLYFDSLTEQRNHFESKYTHRTFTNQTYQRYAKNKLRIREFPGNLYEYNYLAFKNNNDYKQKIFYCFITSVEYVSENTTEVTYELDYMQTYFFDYRLGMCFVEREHSETDEIGDNLVPEGLELGEYIGGAPTFINDTIDDEGNVKYGLNSLRICVASTVDVNGDDTSDAVAAIYNGLPSGLNIITFEISKDGINDYNDFITKVVKSGKPDAIVSVFLAPKSVAIQAIVGGTSIINKKEVFTKTKNYFLISRSDGQPIKNKKLYTSPYNFLYVSNMQGNSACFPYEFFEGDECTFQWFGNFSPNPSVALVPMYYKNIPENYDEKMILSGYPQISYNVDTYKAWLAQNRGTLAVDALSIGATIAVGAITGGASLYATALTGTASAITKSAISADASRGATSIEAFTKTASLLAAVQQKSIMPDQARGGGDPLIMATANLLNFIFIPKFIRPEFVTIIDDFFNMYGYATKRVKIPNINSRPIWNYVKTIGCNIFPNENGLSSMGMSIIKNIFDNGITFWKPTAIVGDYSQDNTISGG